MPKEVIFLVDTATATSKTTRRKKQEKPECADTGVFSLNLKQTANLLPCHRKNMKRRLPWLCNSLVRRWCSTLCSRNKHRACDNPSIALSNNCDCVAVLMTVIGKQKQQRKAAAPTVVLSSTDSSKSNRMIATAYSKPLQSSTMHVQKTIS